MFSRTGYGPGTCDVVFFSFIFWFSCWHLLYQLDFPCYCPLFFGIVTGITFTLHLWIVVFIRFSTYFEKSAFTSGLLFLRDRALFSILSAFLFFRPNPYTRMCVSTIGSFSRFGQLVNTYGQTLVESCFLLVSLILDSFVHFIYSLRITVWRWGTTSGSFRCSEGYVPFVDGGPLPGP